MKSIPIDSNGSNIPLSQLIKSWEKVALLVASLVSIVILGLGFAHFSVPIPPVAYYAVGGGGLALTLLSTISTLCLRKRQVNGQPSGVEHSQLARANPSKKLLSVEAIIQEAHEYIDGLTLGEEIPNCQDESLKRDYTKEELKSDFIQAAEEEKDTLDKGAKRLQKMRAALPYHLGLKKEEYSSYKCIGIPNRGFDCGFIAALQALVHTHHADYALLRPYIELLPSKSDLKPIQELDEDADWKAQMEVEEAKCHNQKIYDAYTDYEWKKQMRPALLSMIEKMRAGTKLHNELNRFYSNIETPLGGVGFLFNIFNSFAPPRYLPRLAYIKTADFNHTDWLSLSPVLILSGENLAHYKTVVRKQNGLFELNDSRVTQTSAESIRQNAMSWKPSLILNGMDAYKATH